MLDRLLEQVKDAIFKNPDTPHQPGKDPGGLIGQIEQLFGGFGGQRERQDGQQGGFDNVRPASEDPLGDPGSLPGQGYGQGARNEQFDNVRPASEDPLGDPADGDQGRLGNVRPASEDPLGDPADDEWRQRRAG